MYWINLAISILAAIIAITAIVLAIMRREQVDELPNGTYTISRVGPGAYEIRPVDDEESDVGVRS